jgi:hypothetical protein
MRIVQPNGKRLYVKSNRKQEDNIKPHYNQIVREIVLDSFGS